jgi:predicted DNA-binding transcriptional regulator AlpA
MNDYLTETELAKQLQMSRQTLLALRKDGLPYRKVRGVIRYVPEEVDAWLAVHCQGKRLSNEQQKET